MSSPPVKDTLPQRSQPTTTYRVIEHDEIIEVREHELDNLALSAPIVDLAKGLFWAGVGAALSALCSVLSLPDAPVDGPDPMGFKRTLIWILVVAPAAIAAFAAVVWGMAMKPTEGLLATIKARPRRAPSLPSAESLPADPEPIVGLGAGSPAGPKPLPP